MPDILQSSHRVLRVLHGLNNALRKVCAFAVFAVSAFCLCGASQAAESVPQQALRLDSPNVNPGLGDHHPAVYLGNGKKKVQAILAEKKYDLKKQRQIHNTAIFLQQQPFEHLAFLIEGLDNEAYSLTTYGPGSGSFRDMSVADVCDRILRSVLDSEAYDSEGKEWKSYWHDVICNDMQAHRTEELDFDPRRAEVKKCVKKWLEQRKQMAPWEIQYEVLKWAIDRRTKNAQEIDIPGTSTEDFYRYHHPDTRELYRQMQAVKEAKRSIAFSVGRHYDLVDYMSGLFDPK